jgi:hypothetical protein
VLAVLGSLWFSVRFGHNGLDTAFGEEFVEDTGESAGKFLGGHE